MCGILCVIKAQGKAKNIDDELLEKIKDALNLMEHRGPDASGIKEFGEGISRHAVFGHTRLSIIDLTDEANQPMMTEDGRYFIIFNGELYNYIELREELSALGVNFRTKSDTEVLLKSYRQWGIEVLNQLNGMFSFIIWDKKEEQILLVRDRFGIKPLYYTYIDDLLVLSSEMKPLIFLRDNEVSPNESIIWDFLSYGVQDRKDETFFNEIQRFPAAHYGRIDTQGNLSIVRYWDLAREVKKLQNDGQFKKRDVDDHIQETKRLFLQSVQYRLRSDVPVGSCLSGGVDSSSIVSVIKEIVPKEDKANYETFSIVFDPSLPISERKFVDIVTKEKKIKNNRYTPTADDINQLFETFMTFQEEPVGGLSPFSQFCVMGLASHHNIKVLLDGQGADEILAGYFHLGPYYFYELFKKLSWIRLAKEMKIKRYPKAAISFLAQFLPNFLHRKIISIGKGMERQLKPSFVKKYRKKQKPTLLMRRHTLNQALMTSLEKNFQHLLRYEDRNSMAFSIESRVPFLDYRLVIYLLALPSEYIINKGTTKWIFKKAMEGLTPAAILDRQDKLGFAVPEEMWIKNNDLKLITDLKMDLHPFMLNYISEEKINKLIVNKKALSFKNLKFLFRLGCLNTWFRLFFNNPVQEYKRALKSIENAKINMVSLD
ncbi:MAG: asparagine synthase (glutamine-hydrolyzing) [Candidatus Hermodarchaeota archaeon]